MEAKELLLELKRKLERGDSGIIIGFGETTKGVKTLSTMDGTVVVDLVQIAKDHMKRLGYEGIFSRD
jgi:hypothetical protein